jgi:hypothetical protein
MAQELLDLVSRHFKETWHNALLAGGSVQHDLAIPDCFWQLQVRVCGIEFSVAARLPGIQLSQHCPTKRSLSCRSSNKTRN